MLIGLSGANGLTFLSVKSRELGYANVEIAKDGMRKPLCCYVLKMKEVWLTDRGLGMDGWMFGMEKIHRAFSLEL